MVHRPTRVGTVGSCIAFEEDSPGVFVGFLQEEHSSNAGPTRADQCLDGWPGQVLSGFLACCQCALSGLVSDSWQTLINLGPTRAYHLFWRGCALEGIADA